MGNSNFKCILKNRLPICLNKKYTPGMNKQFRTKCNAVFSRFGDNSYTKLACVCQITVLWSGLTLSYSWWNTRTLLEWLKADICLRFNWPALSTRKVGLGGWQACVRWQQQRDSKVSVSVQFSAWKEQWHGSATKVKLCFVHDYNRLAQ